MNHLNTLDLLMMAAYAGMMLGIAWRYARRNKTSEDYFVAGRNANPLVVGISMIAALFSSISFLTTPGELITYGPGLAWGMLHIPFTFVIVGYFIIPRIMRHKVTSGYELLEERFGPRVRMAASLLFVVSRLVWMAFIVFLSGKVLAGITGVPLPYMLAAVGIITTAATAAGGIRAVMATDVVQFIFHIGSAVLVVAFVTYRLDGFSWWPRWGSPELTSLQWPEVKVFSLNAFDRVTIVGALVQATLWWVCAATSDQMMIQRFLCTPDARSARRSFLSCLLGDGAFNLVLWIIGFAILGYFQHFAEQSPKPAVLLSHQADDLFPHLISTVLPAGLRGIIIAALFSDIMQSLSGGISALGSALITDFKPVFARGVDDERQLTRRARLVGLFIGAAAIALSYAIAYVPGRNLFDVGYRLSGLFLGPLFVVFAMAFFVRIATPAGAWAALLVGLGAGVLFSYWRQIVGLFVDSGELSVLLILPLTVVCSLWAGVLASLLSSPRVGSTKN